jgi:triosephosphate isomerase
LSDRKPLIAGNWKMNLDHQQAIALVQKLAWTLKDVNHDYDKVEVAVFPPFTDLRSVQTLLDADKLQLVLGAQDLSKHESGAFTGDISGQFLKKLDVKYVLVGHSERRTLHNEDDELVQAKVAAAFKSNLTPVICVGETLEQLEEQGAAAVPISQLQKALDGHKELGEFIVAYEPVWAIGTGKTASTAQAQEIHAFIRKLLSQKYSPAISQEITIQYGGSVKPENAAELFAAADIDGALVGGAALQSRSFVDIVKAMA